MLKNKKQLAEEICSFVGYDGEIDTNKVTVKFLLLLHEALHQGALLREVKEDLRLLKAVAFKIPLTQEEVANAVKSIRS